MWEVEVVSLTYTAIRLAHGVCIVFAITQLEKCTLLRSDGLSMVLLYMVVTCPRKIMAPLSYWMTVEDIVMVYSDTTTMLRC